MHWELLNSSHFFIKNIFNITILIFWWSIYKNNIKPPTFSVIKETRSLINSNLLTANLICLWKKKLGSSWTSITLFIICIIILWLLSTTNLSIWFPVLLPYLSYTFLSWLSVNLGLLPCIGFYGNIPSTKAHVHFPMPWSFRIISRVLRPCVMFLNIYVFRAWSLMPNPQAGGSFLVSCPRLSIYLKLTSISGGLLFHL